MKKIDLKSLFYISLVFFIPFFILFIFSFFLIPNRNNLTKEVIAFGMQSFVFLMIYFLINNKSYKSYFIVISNFILSLLLMIKLGFYYNFKSKLSSSVLYIIYETNNTESIEFLSNYISFKLILLYAFIFSFFGYFTRIFILKKKKSQLIKNIFALKTNHFIYKILAIVLITVSVFLIQKKCSDENFIIKSYTSFKEYKMFKKNFKEVLALETNKNITVKSYSKEPQTFVVIIGESTSNWHMQLYNYNRETNPLLSQIKDELLIFKNIRTPHVHTIHALEKILTLIDTKNRPIATENTSIIQLANQANYETYWLSNQRPIGINESIPSLIGNAAKHKYFFNTEDFDTITHDEVLLPTLDSILKDNHKKRIIFLHLMGTHIQYENRYPKNFDYFKNPNKLSKYKYAKAVQTVNQYDNAVRYNDYIVRTVIEKVRAKNLNSFVLYFSDHGDEVYDTIDWSGHSSGINSEPMFDVPLILWTSNTFKKENPFVIDISTDRKYNLEHFIHSFGDITKIHFKGYQKELSLFNSNTNTNE